MFCRMLRELDKINIKDFMEERQQVIIRPSVFSRFVNLSGYYGK